MTSGTVNFNSVPNFSMYDLQFQASNPSQLEIPTLNLDGNWEFDSYFDITYTAVVSVSLEPAHSVTGFGQAHAMGIAPGGIEPKVYDTELVTLNLFGLSPIARVDVPRIANATLERADDGRGCVSHVRVACAA